MELKIINERVTLDELKKMAEGQFVEMIKAVVDIEKEIMAVGGDLHADEEALLLDQGSKQENLWGINLYLENYDGDFVEFDSMINLRPSQGNRSRGVEDPNLQERIKEVLNKLVTND